VRLHVRTKDSDMKIGTRNQVDKTNHGGLSSNDDAAPTTHVSTTFPHPLDIDPVSETGGESPTVLQHDCEFESDRGFTIAWGRERQEQSLGV
jgi:hypothetical protein